MLTRAIVILALLLGACCKQAPEYTAPIPAELALAASECTVQVSRPGRRWCCGTGTILQNRPGRPFRVLTSNHVVSHNAPYTVRGVRSARHVMTVWRRDLKRDLAVLESVRLPNHIGSCEITMGPAPVRGDRVFILGWRPQDAMTYSAGHVTAEEVDGGVRALLVDAFIRPGFSGSGLWDHRGRLVGVVDSIYGNPITGKPIPGKGVAVHTQEILRFLSNE